MSEAETGVVLDSFTSHSEPERYRARYDRTDTPASMAVVAVVSKALGRDPVEMDQLYYAVDADALDTLLGDGDVTDAVSVTFDYEDHEITATPDKVIAVRPPTDERSDARGGESASV